MKHESFVKGLTSILSKRGALSKSEQESLAEAFRGSEKQYFDNFLLEEGIVDKEDLLPALAEYFQVPYFDVAGFFFDHALLKMFPKDLLCNYAVIPVEIDENMMIMVASNPNDPELLSLLGTYVSYDIQFRVGIQQDIVDAVEEYYDLSPTGADFEEDLDQTRKMREADIKEEKDITELANEDYERE